jgi:hypothetical protein
MKKEWFVAIDSETVDDCYEEYNGYRVHCNSETIVDEIEKLSDALVIAASHELLKACKGLIATYAPNYMETIKKEGIGALHTSVARAIAAIGKAERG